MGQYFFPVNTRRREMIDPSLLGDCLKGWRLSPNSDTRQLVERLIESGRWSREDIVIQGDEGSAYEWGGDPRDPDPSDGAANWEDFTDVTRTIMEASA